MVMTNTIRPNDRIERLSAASLGRVVEPDLDLPGELGPGPVIAGELLSVCGLDLSLSPDQQARLAREEVASIVAVGLRFEAALMSGFSLALVSVPELTDARVVYALHEMGEETRHSRLFCRLLGQLGPTTRNPLDHWLARRLLRLGVLLVICRSALLDVLVLAGEEIPDLFQKLAAQHPDTDPFLAQVNLYHRQEEARHLAFARTVLPEHWAKATWTDRLAVRYIAPTVIRGMFDFLVHPGVYQVADLPRWTTWWAANRTAQRGVLRQEATLPVLRAVVDGGVLRPGRIPRGWRRLCQVDAQGAALGAPELNKHHPCLAFEEDSPV
ncbi:MAG: hypothetical protein DLM54_03930 [Acidimicrobiales bacterium]|nr:MAG: hypothetical protein DLM54_03930 [Acidimicrobiales bacterium]